MRALVLVLIAAVLPAATWAGPWDRVRHGGGFQEDFLLGNMKGPTLNLMLSSRLVTWRGVEPFSRVRQDLELLATGEDWRDRRAAIDDLAFHPSERVEEGLIRALRDPVLAVHDRAAEALGEIGTNRALSPMIDALAYSPGPTRDVLGHSLYQLTGQRYGRHRDRWLRWVSANRDLLR